MTKYVVLSVNDNPDYLYFTPLTCWAWIKFGWEPIVFFVTKSVGFYDRNIDPTWRYVFIESAAPIPLYTVETTPGYRSDTVSQMSRLYAACLYRRGAYLMTGDIDMLPLSDYWQPNGGITVWGHDLTGYTHYPICYIGMSSENWLDVMQLRENGEVNKDYSALIKRDLDAMPDAKSGDFYKYWFTDQELITQRLKPYKPTIINRGQYNNGFARGRVDRGAWSLDHKQFIDCHMHHQIHHRGNEWKFEQTMEMLRKVWPDEDFGWFVKYHNEYKIKTGHG